MTTTDLNDALVVEILKRLKRYDHLDISVLSTWNTIHDGAEMALIGTSLPLQSGEVLSVSYDDDVQSVCVEIEVSWVSNPDIDSITMWYPCKPTAVPSPDEAYDRAMAII